MLAFSPSGLEDVVFSRAILIGLARVGLLQARTRDAVAAVNTIKDCDDWRYSIPPVIINMINNGDIRCDGLWSRKADNELQKLAKASIEFVPDSDQNPTNTKTEGKDDVEGF